ncbi:pentapeptide repeat-containing protein [Candidatus Dependentiae bacterium]
MQRKKSCTLKKHLYAASVVISAFTSLSPACLENEFEVKGNNAVEKALATAKNSHSSYTHIFCKGSTLDQAEIITKDIRSSYFGPLKQGTPSRLDCGSLHIKNQCDASGSVFNRCDFDVSYFEKSNFQHTLFYGCRFQDGNYEDLSINCQIIECNFERTKFSNTVLDYTYIANSNFSHSSWKNVTLKNCIITGNTSFFCTDLRGINFVMEPEKKEAVEDKGLDIGISRTVDFRYATAYEDQRKSLIDYGATDAQLASMRWVNRAGSSRKRKSSKQSSQPKRIKTD